MSSWYGLLAGLLVAMAAPATAAEFRDASGFSFRYPDDWIAVTKATAASASPEIQERLQNGSVDLSRISVVVIAPSIADIAANVSAVLLPACFPINEKSKQDLTDTIRKRVTASGARIERFRSEVTRFGSNDAIVLDFDSSKPGSPLLFRQRQIFFTGGQNSIVATFTAAAEQFADVESQFDMIESSFYVPPLSLKGWWKMYGGSLLYYTLVGAITIFVVWAKRKASAPLKATASSVAKKKETESNSE